MKLTPVDINSKEFKKTLRGYNIEEVDEYLDQIVENYEELYKENMKLSKELGSLNERVEYYEKLEGTIQNTLILAQNAADQAKESSRQESILILKNANESAQKILDKAHGDVVGINEEYDRVKSEFIKFRTRFKGFMNMQVTTFEELEKELTKSYNISEVVPELELNSTEFKDEEEKEEKQEQEEKFIEEDMSEIKSFFANN